VHPVVAGLNRAITVATGLKMLDCPVKPHNGIKSIDQFLENLRSRSAALDTLMTIDGEQGVIAVSSK
jgi:hypothetical protein